MVWLHALEYKETIAGVKECSTQHFQGGEFCVRNLYTPGIFNSLEKLRSCTQPWKTRTFKARTFFHFFLLFNDKLDMKDFNKTAVFRCNFSIWHLLSYVIHFNEPLNDSRGFEIIKTNVVFGAHFFRLGGEHSEHLTGSFISLFHGLIKQLFFFLHTQRSDSLLEQADTAKLALAEIT